MSFLTADYGILTIISQFKQNMSAASFTKKTMK